MAKKFRRLPVTPIVIALVIVAIVSALFSLTLGAEKVPVEDVFEIVKARLTGTATTSPFDTIIWELRLPRALLSLLVGAGLAIAGAAMQTLVQNPLADPYLLGISSGASVGATAVIVLGVFSSVGVYALSLGAMVGAITASAAVYFIAQAQGGLTPLRMVLAGVVMSSAFSALASFMVFLSDDNRAANSVMFWMLGSVAGATWEKLIVPVVAVAISLVALMLISSWMDALMTGPSTAAALGIRVGAMRNGLFIGSSVLIGVLVAVAGGIGFVGLIIPHASRMIVGALHKRMLPVCAAGGAVFLLWVDVISRVVARPQEMPLGVVTGVVGAPLFLFLMGRRSYAFGSRDA